LLKINIRKINMEQLTIPRKALISLLKTQPKDVLFDVFENLLISWDDSPLTTDEIIDIEKAKSELLKKETVLWQK